MYNGERGAKEENENPQSFDIFDKIDSRLIKLERGQNDTFEKINMSVQQLISSQIEDLRSLIDNVLESKKLMVGFTFAGNLGL